MTARGQRDGASIRAYSRLNHNVMDRALGKSPIESILNWRRDKPAPQTIRQESFEWFPI